jgi:hypothetical protein
MTSTVQRLAWFSVLLIGALTVVRAQTLYSLPPNVETRWASPENPTGAKGVGGTARGGRKGAASVSLKAGEHRTLAEVSGHSGIVRRIWLTLSNRSPQVLRGVRLDIYWDDGKKPAVSAPLGDFFGIGLGQTAAFQSALFSSPEARSFDCVVQMPFRRGMRMTITNEGDIDIAALYYDVDYTLDDAIGPDALYFHAYFHRESPTRLGRDFEVLPRMQGAGRFIGANFGVLVDRTRYGDTWWGEGEIKMFIDGDGERPTLNGTGTEDYVGAGFALGPFSHLYQGAPIVDHDRGRFTFYRYHVPDPVYFRRDIRVTIQQIGILLPRDADWLARRGAPLPGAGPGAAPVDGAGGTPALFEREDDWSSCAYLYLTTPDDDLPALASVQERIRGTVN